MRVDAEPDEEFDGEVQNTKKEKDNPCSNQTRNPCQARQHYHLNQSSKKKIDNKDEQNSL